MKCVVDRYKWHRPFQMATTVLRNGNDRLRKGNLPRRPPSWTFIRSILFILPLGAEWMEGRSVHSEIGMRNRKTRANFKF